MPGCDIRRAYHTPVISTDISYSHVTKRVRKNVSLPPHLRQRGMRRDADIGTSQLTPNSYPAEYDSDDTSAWIFHEIQVIGPGERDSATFSLRHRYTPLFDQIKYLISPALRLKLQNCNAKFFKPIIFFIQNLNCWNYRHFIKIIWKI